jgi:DNA (cytosine-5)-methyltransferase 1
MKPQVLDLFSGIGGFALAFEAAGFETAAFAEIEPYPCKVLAQHWPEVPNLGDVRGINGADYRGAVDVVCGGFPCQDISLAGKGAGITGARSGLWVEMLRIIRGSRPRFCLLENVPSLRTRGYDRVASDLEEAGYQSRPFVVGAANAGAPHLRPRVWVCAYADRQQHEKRPPEDWGPAAAVVPSDRHGMRELQPQGSQQEQRGRVGDRTWWAAEPALDRVAYGVPRQSHRIKALGNSIVPAVAYPFALWIASQLKAVAP